MTASTYDLYETAQTSAVGDFNGDGKADLLIGLPSDYAYYVALGHGDGTFTPNYYVGTEINGIAVSDFNLDGKQDAAVINGPNSIAVLFGDGTGAFSAGPSIAIGGQAVQILQADLNRDGVPDLVVTTSTGLQVLLGAGDGTFSSATTVAADATPVASVVGDFNGDGLTDLAVATTTGISLLLGNGDGAFVLSTTPVSLSSLAQIAAADLNSDGKLDLIVFSSSSIPANIPTSYVLYGNGDGTFQAPLSYQISENEGNPTLSPLQIADINGDGFPDIVSASTEGITVLYNQSGTSFALPLQFAYPSTLSHVRVGPDIATADFNSDGRVDVIEPGEFLMTFFGSECAISVSPATVALDNSETPATITITTNGEACEWATPPGNYSVSPGTALGTAIIQVSTTPNTTGADITGSIQINDVTVPVVQRFTAQIFADVLPADSDFDAVNLLYQKGITSGCSAQPRDFCPNDPVTRAQIAIFLVRSVYGSDNFTYSPTPYFADVPAGRSASPGSRSSMNSE